MPSVSFLIPCSAPAGAVDPRDAGGKGYNLFVLAGSGLPVPSWFVVSSALFEKVVGRHRDEIGKILDAADPGRPASLQDASRRIGWIIHRAQWPSGLRSELEKAARDLGCGRFLSVRSSLVGEDGPDHSFAGQLNSYLNVPPEKVPRAVAAVWASAYSARSLAYRRRRMLDADRVSAAVIVQRMVRSRAAGVLFTRDPGTRSEECVISAGLGLGEGVVSNQVETDTFVIPRRGRSIDRRIEEKTARVVERDTWRGGSRLDSVPPDLRREPVLSDREIRRLRRMALLAERTFGAPQDIEWALDGDGGLFLLQSRPIVFAAPCPSTEGDVRVWDNSNIVESYPGLTLPLTFSFVRRCYEVSFRKAAQGFVLRAKTLEDDLPIFESMVGLIEGRVYYNLLNWYRMLSYLPGFPGYQRLWDEMLGIGEKTPCPDRKSSLFDRGYALVFGAFLLLTVRGNGRRFFRHFDAFYARRGRMDLSGLDEHRLADLYGSIERDLAGRWHLTLYNDFAAMKYFGWLKRICAAWGLDALPDLANRLLCGERGVESVAPLRSLVSLVEIFRSRPFWRTLLERGTEREAWEAILRHPECEPLERALRAHLAAYGDRGREDLKLDKPTLSSDPPALISLLRRQAESGIPADRMGDRELRIRGEAERAARKVLKNPFRRLVFSFVLAHARRAIANREGMRFSRSRLFGIIRRLFTRMGELFAEKGLIHDAADIHYLAVEEVFGMVRGCVTTRDLKALVRLRREDYARFSKTAPPDRFRTRGIPCTEPIPGRETAEPSGKVLTGTGCSSGSVEAPAAVLADPGAAPPKGEHILVAGSTDPGWVFLMASSSGIVVERGSVLSHTAIIGRELGIPTVVGVKHATKIIPNGSRIHLNGGTGEIRWR